MRSAGTELPPYVREALADALLNRHRPEAARLEYAAVLQADGVDTDLRDAARIGQFYASVEMEDFDAAYTQADQLAASEPVWQRYAGILRPILEISGLRRASSLRRHGSMATSRRRLGNVSIRMGCRPGQPSSPAERGRHHASS